MRQFGLLFPLLLLAFLAPAVQAQYVFLDANGDGVNDSSDQLPATGPIDLDVYFVTNQNRDGSPATCSNDPSASLTINTYEIVLQALRGKIAFGPMRNQLQFSGSPVRFATYEDTTSTTFYHNGWGDYIIMPPGRYKVATLTVEVLEGSPSLAFLTNSPARPVGLTAFGTKCPGINEDNTATLGEEFHDAGGIGGPAAVAAGPYYGYVNRDIRFNGSRSADPDGGTLAYRWTFDDGGSALGAMVAHAFSTAGEHSATLTVSSPSGSDSDVARVFVEEEHHPIAKAGGPYRGETGARIEFNGSASSDADGDALSYLWSFGDGTQGSGALPHHIYVRDGEFSVVLTVSDGIHTSTDRTTATIVTVVRPENRAPIANAGGPYRGVINRWIQFDATKSSDADGDVLNFHWEFGDGTTSPGIAPVHEYARAGAFTARVRVSDGRAVASAEAAVAITAAFPAEAFLDPQNDVVNVDDPLEFLIVRFEPLEGAFPSDEVDPDQVVLRVTRFDETFVDVPADGAAIEQDDSDQDGVAEFVSRFPRQRFREMLAGGEVQGRTQLELRGNLYGGGSLSGAFDATFVRSNSFDLTVTPNPFNPTAHLILHTRSDGPMTARLFDSRGRRVKTILRGEPMRSGRHDLLFDARDDSGSPLASGVYFLQVTSLDGTRTGRVVVAK